LRKLEQPIFTLRPWHNTYRPSVVSQAAQILMRRNVMIWNAAIYYTRVEPGMLMVCLRYTLA
jgi:hypothetical protein